MQLTNEFTIDVPIDVPWQALNHSQLVAPCFPGTALITYEGNDFSGTVKVKLGPISLTYRGKGSYVERDDDAHTVVISARGRDARGNGTAGATVTGKITEAGPGASRISISTDLSITGKPAQFGRGAITDVADSVIGKFASCLAQKLAEKPEDSPAEATGTAAEPAGPTALPARSTTDDEDNALPVGDLTPAVPPSALRATAAILE